MMFLIDSFGAFPYRALPKIYFVEIWMVMALNIVTKKIIGIENALC